MHNMQLFLHMFEKHEWKTRVSKETGSSTGLFLLETYTQGYKMIMLND